jgi:hypothetical protein
VVVVVVTSEKASADRRTTQLPQRMAATTATRTRRRIGLVLLFAFLFLLVDIVVPEARRYLMK